MKKETIIKHIENGEKVIFTHLSGHKFATIHPHYTAEKKIAVSWNGPRGLCISGIASNEDMEKAQLAIN